MENIIIYKIDMLKYLIIFLFMNLIFEINSKQFIECVHNKISHFK